MAKELIWGVLVLSLILTAYLSHVEDRRHKEAIARLEARKLEVQVRMRELDKAHEERTREIHSKLAAASKTEEVTANGHA